MAKASAATMDTNTESRLSTLETQVQNLSTTSSSNFAALFAKFDQLSSELSKAGRYNVTTICTIVGAAAVLVGAIGNSYIRPIELEIAHLQKGHDEILETRAALHSEMRADIRKARDVADAGVSLTDRHAAVVAAKLTEIETQFGWLNDVVNMRDQRSLMLESLLWKKNFGEYLPEAHLPEAGPGAKPHNRAQANGFH